MFLEIKNPLMSLEHQHSDLAETSKAKKNAIILYQLMRKILLANTKGKVQGREWGWVGCNSLKWQLLVGDQGVRSGSFQDDCLSSHHFYLNHRALGHTAVTTHRPEANKPLPSLEGKPSTDPTAECSSPCCISCLFYGTSQHIPKELLFQICRIFCKVLT